MMEKLIGKEVEVVADDVTYRGILIEIGEEEMHLESSGGWIVIPVEKIASVQEVLD
ncbi:MAG: hypothetical protein HZC12_02705 [Nitrospirae bacterium]|nr:hypothetical protein [Nitrospirota bacterium]